MSNPCDWGMCNGSGCVDCLPEGISKVLDAEEKAIQRGADQYVEEKTYVSSPSFTLTDKHSYTNNTFINRYLENRHPNSPK